jgi:ribonucleoside-diphosphate reductase alpha chain
LTKKSNSPWLAEMPKDLKPVRLNDVGRATLDKRYRWKNEKGKFTESYEEMFWRIAWNVAQAEKTYGQDPLVWARKYYDLMAEMKFLPNSPAIANAGRNSCMSACFVADIDDSMEGIYQSVMNNALIQKHGGGVGTDFSKLRAKGTLVGTSGGQASGPVSFMKVINYSTDSIKQGGIRRGACMGMLSVHHPDILEFIDCKAVLQPENVKLFKDYALMLIKNRNREVDQPLISVLEGLCDWQGNPIADYVEKYQLVIVVAEPGLQQDLKYYHRDLLDTQFKNFNISVAYTDEFMEALENGEEYNLYDKPYDNKNRKIVGKLSAQKVWDKATYNAWFSAEPGCIFIDTVNKSNPVRETEGEITCTNPCGEQPLLPYESCNLGSMVVSRFVDDKGVFSPNDFMDAVRIATRFLDDLIDINPYPLKIVDENTKKHRRIGLGYMGIADALIMMGESYASDMGRAIVISMTGMMNDVSIEVSEELAIERGPFPNWENSDIPTPRRNLITTTVAPTGTISLIADASSGIEPLFGLAFTKTVMDGVPLVIMSDAAKTYLKRMGLYSDEVAQKIAQTGMVIEGLLPEDVRQVLLVSSQITPEQHILMQAAAQKFIGSAISKTINCPADISVEDLGKAMLLAYKTGCKGATVYRDGSRGAAPLSLGAGSTNAVDHKNTTMPIKTDGQGQIIPHGRPDEVGGSTKALKIACGKLYVTVNFDKFGICEVFTTNGKKGGCTSQSEATSRLFSVARRCGVSPEVIIEQLKGISCKACVKNKELDGISCPDAIAKYVERKYAEWKVGKINPVVSAVVEGKKETKNPVCEICGKEFQMVEGCMKCMNCGNSKC